MPGFIQYNGNWQDVAKGQRVRLYRWVNDDWRFYDYGYKKFTDKYLERGLMVGPDEDWAHPSTLQLPTANKTTKDLVSININGNIIRKLAD